MSCNGANGLSATLSSYHMFLHCLSSEGRITALQTYVFTSTHKFFSTQHCYDVMRSVCSWRLQTVADLVFVFTTAVSHSETVEDDKSHTFILDYIFKTN